METTAPAAGVPDLWMTTIRSFATLVLVLGVLILLLYLMRRFLNKGQFTDKGYIKMLSTFYLAPKERIVLVEVLGEKILLGITPQNITFLAKIDCANMQLDLPDDAMGKASSANFKTVFGMFKGKDGSCAKTSSEKTDG